jgi:alpha-D-ribose 1-methylphosphonate 5-triphosphate synthase subunit PhnI
MYVSVKGGAAAIENSWRLLAGQRRGDTALPELSVAQIREQLPLAVDRVMSEGSLYDRELAALAVKQAGGDLVEAIFLLRAYRTTLPRFGYSLPMDTARMQLVRRVSATFKDVPGGQVLGPTYDYTQRLLDFALLAEGGTEAPEQVPTATQAMPASMPRVNELMAREGLMETPQPVPDSEPGDLTREPLMFPASGRCACRPWRAATKAGCWRWVIRPSAVMPTPIPSPARYGAAPCRWKSFPTSWALPSTSATLK